MLSTRYTCQILVNLEVKNKACNLKNLTLL